MRKCCWNGIIPFLVDFQLFRRKQQKPGHVAVRPVFISRITDYPFPGAKIIKQKSRLIKG